MADLTTFENKHREDKGKFPSAPAKTIKKYTGILPDFLLEMWAEKGFHSYSNGFLWLVNPDDLEEVMQLLLPDFPEAIPVLRTAMGHIIFLQDGAYRTFDPVDMDVVKHGDFTLEEVMNFSITEDESLDEFYHRQFYEKAFKRLGPVTYDECYGFVPAIALGGDLDAANLQKMKLKVYLQILSQLE